MLGLGTNLLPLVRQFVYVTAAILLTQSAEQVPAFAQSPSAKPPGMGGPQASGTVDCSKRPRVSNPPTDKEKEEWLIYWQNCGQRETSWTEYLVLNVLPLMPSACTPHRLPDRTIAGRMCSTCMAPGADALSVLECIGEQVRLWIGESQSGTDPGQNNCNDYSAITSVVLNSCAGFRASIRCGMFPSSTGTPDGARGHCWLLVRTAQKCYLFDPFNQIYTEYPCT
jgi:hypothetical protein